mgnify:CR=1 FL=1
MVRGTIPFKCSECGKRFMSLGIEWNAIVFSAPQKCPGCGSMHTRPWSISPSFIQRYSVSKYLEVL